MKKRLVPLVLSFSLCLSLSLPAMATSGLDEADLSDAYIGFSEQLADMDITVQTCYEDFVSGYESFAGESVQEYVDELVEYEIQLTPQLEDGINANLRAAAEFYAANPPEPATRASVRGKWYDNIGESSPKLPQSASYDTYNILSTVKKGDIVHETSGVVASLVGHIAIVEGKYWDSTYKQYYIRTVEATLPNVTHGALDDERYDDRGVDIYYVTDASSSEKSGAVSYCIGQIGKPWRPDLNIVSKLTADEDNPNLYCSELVWAAYYSEGINLNGSTIPNHLYMPDELASSSKLTYRDVE